MIDEKQNKKITFKEKKANISKHIKDIVSFFMPIIIAVILLLPMPYYVKLGGGIIELDDKIQIDKEGKNGFFGALYVRESKAVVLTYLLSYVVPSFDKEKIEDTHLENESAKEYNTREKLYFTSSLDAATKVAFEKAGEKVEIASSKFIVVYKDKTSKSNLEVGDQILKVNNIKFTTYEDMLSLIEKSDKYVEIEFLRNGKVMTDKTELVSFEGAKRIGIVISREVTYTSDPKVNTSFNGRQAGPSGGLMIALTIYDKLVEEDITKGRVVVGTGTIDLNGNVGEIGGIKQKLIGANNKKADVVFVPAENYKEAKKIKDRKGYKFDLVSVKTFDDAVNYLKEK